MVITPALLNSLYAVLKMSLGYFKQHLWRLCRGCVADKCARPLTCQGTCADTAMPDIQSPVLATFSSLSFLDPETDGSTGIGNDCARGISILAEH